MANSLTGLIQTIYEAMDVVSREPIGFIGSVSKSVAADRVSLNQPIRAPVVPEQTVSDISPSNVSSTGSDDDIGYVDLNITKQRKTSFHFTAEEELSLQEAGVVNPISVGRIAQSLRALSNEMERDLANLAVEASRAAGTAGTIPFNTNDNLEDLSNTARILTDNGAPVSDRAIVLNTTADAKLQGKQSSVFKVNEAGDGGAGRRMGRYGNLLGFDIAVSGQISEHDCSGSISGLLVNGAAAAGATAITVDGGGSGETLNVGDTVTFAGDSNVYLVQAMAASATTLTLNAPGLREAAADNTAITAGADYTPNVAFSRDAFMLAVRPPAFQSDDAAVDRLLLPDPYSGLMYEFTIWPQYRQLSYEVAICWGVKCIKPEHSAILMG